MRGTWRYGFEWPQFYCLDCLDKKAVWLDVPADLDRDSERALKRAPGAGIVNVTVEGTFRSDGPFGDGGYPHAIIVKKLRQVAVVSSGMKSLAEQEAAEKRWGCGGTNPK